MVFPFLPFMVHDFFPDLSRQELGIQITQCRKWTQIVGVVYYIIWLSIYAHCHGNECSDAVLPGKLKLQAG